MTFEFIADRPVLDFVATLAARGTSDEEKLRTPGDLADWIIGSGIVDRRPVVTRAQLEHARSVRDALFGVLSALINGSLPAAGDRALVNTAAENPPPRVRLDRRGEVHRTGGVDAVLAVLAGDCLDLFVSPDRDLLRWCADGACTRPFIDRSHGRRRRWCGMKGCGDRAKAAAYRQRQRARQGTATTAGDRPGHLLPDKG